MAAVIRQQQIDGETVLYLGPAALVASKSEPGAWYSVEDGKCSCKGFQYRGACRHLAVAALAAELDRGHAVPVEAVSAPAPGSLACSRCGTTKRRLLTQEALCSPCLAIVHPKPLDCCAATTADPCQPDCAGACCEYVARCAMMGCDATVTIREGESDIPPGWERFQGHDYCPRCLPLAECAGCGRRSNERCGCNC
jgi:hypothetical protein